MKKKIMATILLMSSPLSVWASISKQDIQKLLVAGLPDQTIVNFIRSNRPVDSMSGEDLLDLRRAGASDQLLLELFGNIQPLPMAEAPVSIPIQRDAAWPPLAGTDDLLGEGDPSNDFGFAINGPGACSSEWADPGWDYSYPFYSPRGCRFSRWDRDHSRGIRDLRRGIGFGPQRSTFRNYGKVEPVRSRGAKLFGTRNSAPWGSWKHDPTVRPPLRGASARPAARPPVRIGRSAFATPRTTARIPRQHATSSHRGIHAGRSAPRLSQGARQGRSGSTGASSRGGGHPRGR